MQSKFGIPRDTCITVAATSPGDCSPPAIVCTMLMHRNVSILWPGGVSSFRRFASHRFLPTPHEMTDPGEYSLVFAPILDTFGRASRLPSYPVIATSLEHLVERAGPSSSYVSRMEMPQVLVSRGTGFTNQVIIQTFPEHYPVEKGGMGALKACISSCIALWLTMYPTRISKGCGERVAQSTRWSST